MALFLLLLLAAGGGIIGSASLPTRTQVVLSIVDEAHGVEQPNFGVGFDLTASYGQATCATLAESLQS